MTVGCWGGHVTAWRGLCWGAGETCDVVEAVLT